MSMFDELLPPIEPQQSAHIKYHPEIEQGSDEWLAVRCGILTASNVKHIVSKKTDKKTGEVTFKIPDDDKMWSHVYELAAQRVNNFVEPTFIGHDMMRGHEDEIYACIEYEKHYSALERCGFITNDKYGFKIGYSPDALVGHDGLIECKSRRQKFQFETISEYKVPDEYVLQLQTGLLVSERKWIDFVSYSGGMMMMTLRVFPDKAIQDAIVEASIAFNEKMQKAISQYQERLANKDARFIATERRIYEEMTI